MNKDDSLTEDNYIIKSDGLEHQSYYNKGKIEVIDFIEDQDLNFSLGNSVKYICRAGFKSADTKRRDLKKAQWYITREIQRLDKE